MENETASTGKLHPLAWVAGIAFIALCAAGTAAIMGWLPSSKAKTEQSQTATAQPVAGAATTAGTATTTQSAAAAQPVYVANGAPVATAEHHHRAACAHCGVVVSVREMVVEGQTTGLGAVGGAVIGGVLGNQIGAGRGRDLATVAGAVGGGYAGNSIERNMHARHIFETVVRLDNGKHRVFRYAEPPAWHRGERVRIVDGVIRPL